MRGFLPMARTSDLKFLFPATKSLVDLLGALCNTIHADQNLVHHPVYPRVVLQCCTSSARYCPYYGNANFLSSLVISADRKMVPWPDNISWGAPCWQITLYTSTLAKVSLVKNPLQICGHPNTFPPTNIVYTTSIQSLYCEMQHITTTMHHSNNFFQQLLPTTSSSKWRVPPA